MAEVFISYSRDDRPIAEAVALQLKRLGTDVWWDHELVGGENFRRRILEIVSRAPVTLVLWSSRSVESEWVVGEASAAREKRTLIPLSVDGASPPLDFRPLHTINLGDWVPGENLPAALTDAIGRQIGREIGYGIDAQQPTIIGRTARQVTHAWYLDFESIIFYLMAQGFACFLLSLSFAKLINSELPAAWVAYKLPLIAGFIALIGAVVAPLVMRPVLENRRLYQALPLFLAGTALAVPGYFFSSVFIDQMRDNVLIIVGPTTIMMLLVASLGHRALRR
ncbi:MAG: toll/interleukin-1 receptor domain-containing protein [Hyphomicrobiaceae bacterium]|nr:toll/interleukin-1 receptor domain-containing protein [Hyphomicrobiaceae bacterium]